MSNIQPNFVESFNTVDPQGELPPIDTAVDMMLEQDGETTTLDKVRLLGFNIQDGDASLLMVDEEAQVLEVSLSDIPGLEYFGNGEEGYPVVAFNYFKQEVGSEPSDRIVRLKGVAYGVHQGHQGVPEKNIPAEKPGWYMVADQIGVVGSDNIVQWQDPSGRVFPFARIIDGPLGDPRQKHVQDKFGLY